jgi:hypothetical protein
VIRTVVLRGLDDVRAAAGTTLGPTDWVEITEERLAAWERACPGAPLGWLLLSLTNLFMPEMVTVEDVSAGLNVGTGPIHLADDLALAPGTRVRARGEVTAVDEPGPGAVHPPIRIRVEREGDPHPLVEVDALSRWLG